MNAWNDTKAINFKQVTDYRKANIIVNAGNYSNTGWAGITQLPAIPRGSFHTPSNNVISMLLKLFITKSKKPHNCYFL